jgi:hypothetical protein
MSDTLMAHSTRIKMTLLSEDSVIRNYGCNYLSGTPCSVRISVKIRARVRVGIRVRVRVMARVRR